MTRARDALGYRPTHTVREGLAESIRWYVADARARRTLPLNAFPTPRCPLSPTCSPKSTAATRPSPSSGWATWACPLAVVFAEAGLRVVGLDVSQARMDQINAGESYIEDVPSATVARLVASGHLRGSADFADLADGRRGLDLRPDAARQDARPRRVLHRRGDRADRALTCTPGRSIVLESTTYPGTTREVILPALEADGLVCGEDFFLAFSPERVDPGREDYTTKNTPKVIGGVTPACVEAATALYGVAIDTLVPVSCPRRPRWSSCSRTRSARSTSASSTRS